MQPTNPASVPLVDNPKVKLTVVKWAEFEKALEAHKGQVVVVDFWADWCVPCKREFPHMVEMHQKYAKDGLACVSVSLDEASKSAAPLAFLKKQNAEFDNLLLDEKLGEVAERYNANPPFVRVFGKDGKFVKQFDCTDVDKQFEYSDVEKFALKLLHEGQ